MMHNLERKKNQILRGEYFFLTFFIFFLGSCGNLSLHENFKAHMSDAVGKHIIDGNTWAHKERLVSSQLLESGSREYKYRFRNGCFYFFEVDTVTDLIVDWRFEGSESDCVIAL